MVLPPDLYTGLVRKVQQMSFTDATSESLRRLLGRRSETVTLDRSGRICLPETMSKAAEIAGQAKLVGLLDRFQIWNPERLEKVSALDESLLNEAFKLI